VTITPPPADQDTIAGETGGYGTLPTSPMGGETSMRRAYTQLFIHLVWATWNRLPLITPALEQQLYRALAKKCRDLYCVPLAVGGMVDHVHVLVQMSAAVAVAQLVKGTEGLVVAPDDARDRTGPCLQMAKHRTVRSRWIPRPPPC